MIGRFPVAFLQVLRRRRLQAAAVGLRERALCGTRGGRGRDEGIEMKTAKRRETTEEVS